MRSLLSLSLLLVALQSDAKSHPEVAGQRAPMLALAPGGVFAVYSTETELRGAVVVAEGEIDRSFPIGPPAPGRATIASSREAHLVAWTTQSRELLSRRFTLNGEPLDASPLRIASSVCEPPGAGSDGEQFLIVWGECGSTPGLMSATVSAAGVVSSANTVVAPSEAHRIVPGNPVFGRDHYLLPWISFDGYQPFMCDPYCPIVSSRVARLSVNGERAGSNDTLVLMQPSDWSPARVVWDGARFVVAWIAGPIYSQMVQAAVFENDALGRASVFAHATLFPYSGFMGQLSFAWDGRTYVAVWTERSTSGAMPSDVMLARRSPAQLETEESVGLVRIAALPDREQSSAIVTTADQRIAVAFERGPYTATQVVVRFLHFNEGERRRAVRR